MRNRAAVLGASIKDIRKITNLFIFNPLLPSFAKLDLLQAKINDDINTCPHLLDG